LSRVPEHMTRAASGLVLIVVGVLAALGGDAVWQGRADVIREQELLRDLFEEFGENRERLLADIEWSQESKAAGSAWADAMLGTTSPPLDSVAQLWVLASDWGRFDPVTGSLRSVIDGGELNLIRNEDLRAAVAGWSDVAEEARLTSRDVSVQLAGQAPVALTLEPGGPHNAGGLAAIEVVRAFSEGSLSQLITLLEQLETIIAMIEQELAT
jgi:hypothetical protein